MKLASSLAALVAVAVLASAPAGADPDTSKTDTKADKTANKAKASKKAAKAKASKKAAKAGPDLRVSDKTAAQAIDLFPQAVLGRTTRAPEKHKGLSLGNDSDWKVQAAQATAMVAIFGALVGLCGSGACTVPKSVTDPLPSWLKAKPHHVNDPRPPQKLPKLR